MPRPSLTAERQRPSRDRFNLVAGDAEDRAGWIRQCDAWRAECDEVIRQTKALIARPIAKRDARRRVG